MTDTTPTPKIPPLILTLVHDYAQKALTALSIWVLAHGASQYVHDFSTISGKTDNVLVDSAIQTGVGASLFIASCAWTYIAAYLRKNKMVELLKVIPND